MKEISCIGCKYYDVCGDDERELPCGGYEPGEKVNEDAVEYSLEESFENAWDVGRSLLWMLG